MGADDVFQVGCVLVLFIAMTLLVGRLNRRQDKLSRLAVWLLFLIYCIGYLQVTILSREPGTGVNVSLIPFKTYSCLFEVQVETTTEVNGVTAAFLSGILPITGLILNVLLFYPLGYMLTILFPALKPWYVILIGASVSVATEGIQYLFTMGWCETDDVIHNTLGTAIGAIMGGIQVHGVSYIRKVYSKGVYYE